ncbi:hypothetical protein [uncultured Pseudacidovorax sp.]|uniref:hypothetical protein n=1 Tax=uncultured Pseudacidovorax sp. TaxID=679313 RepID=UPI0025F50FCC|nr:hypothetical protein [uncultured Pseudacidovorax sp.]
MADPKAFDGLPLADQPLSFEDRVGWFGAIDQLLGFAGRPRDWGADSKLGVLVAQLLQVRADLLSEANAAEPGRAPS